MIKPIIFSAAKPTNTLTLGNYIGAIKNWVTLQQDHTCIFSAVDLHAITVLQDPKKLHNDTLFLLASYMACGIDPQKSILFVQSHVGQHSQLGWIIGCYAHMGELARMTQYKDKSSKSGQNIPSGLFNYPWLMAADILLYDTDIVPVGEDQVQHIELCRDIAQRMNHHYQMELFKLPKAFIGKVGSRVMDLQDPTRKMGKSDSTDKGAVFLNDSDKEIEKKIKSAVTDSGTVIEYDKNKPGVKNLIDIQTALTGKSAEQIVKEYNGKMYGHLKMDTAQIVINAVNPIREKTKQLLDDQAYLLETLKAGAQKASELAEIKLVQVHKTIGLLPY